MDKMPKNEDETPQTKIRVAVTVDEKVVAEMKMIHKKEIDFAKGRDASPPDWSTTVELLLRKGIKAYKKEDKI